MSSASSHSVENSNSVILNAIVSPYSLTAAEIIANVNGLNQNENNLNCVIRSEKITKFGFYLSQIF